MENVYCSRHFQSGFRCSCGFSEEEHEGLNRIQTGIRSINNNTVDKPSFSIDSLLSRKCSKNLEAEDAVRKLRDRESFIQRHQDVIRDSRYHPYYTSYTYTSESTPREHRATIERGTRINLDNINSESSEHTRWPLDKPKRMRTIFTVEQLERMEKEFERQQYMVGTDRYFLAAELGLTETQVKVWFQNRRIKWRKQVLERQQRELRGRPVGADY